MSGGTAWESRSPPGASTLITSAPSTPSSLVAHGPTAAMVRSKTRMPSRIFATKSPAAPSARAWLEFRQSDFARHVIENHLDRQPGADIGVRDANEIRQDAR